MRHQNLYQYALICFALVVLVTIGVFSYFELFPEYKKYQHLYKDLEEYRSSYTHEKPAPFSVGIKQILIKKSGGSEVTDRCLSCHIAVDLPHFSPTRVMLDDNGKEMIDSHGRPLLETNPDYVWERVKTAGLENLQWLSIEGKKVDAEKVIHMHPLIGSETRPFQYHPLGQYGCTTCHGGNGQALVSERAHGPVYDGNYHPASHGSKPQFTEKDPLNDPPFSRMYNDKPGHDLVFQTTPMLAGPLLEANCIQCHQSAHVKFTSISDYKEALDETKGGIQKMGTVQEPFRKVIQDRDLIRQMERNEDRLVGNYQKGKELFISQACYACHRIAGFSRASVGPELTQIGNSYPWYIKESIVWPQADLPSSTMPNFRLDHDELAALMTFLMAQKGGSRAISEMDYQIQLSEWEKGSKMPWEEPILPIHLKSVREGQHAFATEGCASCHKLQGFESHFTFVNPQQDSVWFRALFGEEILGSKLARLVEQHAKEITERIIPKASTSHSEIIEEIAQKHPGLIESFYPNFKFAARAYNTTYAHDVEKMDAYRQRLHCVLMMYIEEYGLGRDIAPHLHWSGIYRDDAWLMGHFHNPSLHTPRSIMPVMPFDDSKFLMINHMLHVLGRKNQQKLGSVWKQEGFNPPLAYEMLCSSCHGGQRQGNGIVAEWIYPIPKNLRNALFLHNLTKERAIDSITHGVKGTPMPPWGEAILDQEGVASTPLLSPIEIVQLVDWIYQSVPMAHDTSKKEDFEKWHYMPLDIIHEMKEESLFLDPTPVMTSDLSELTQEFFEKRSPSFTGADEEFYIRDIYYTADNLQAGEEFYKVNCATCHGNEGTGAGLRATSMVEAKPRMFTNLSWLRTHDDLRLLRSIKYGVPGTSMIAWGDQTTAVQRMQLALFIRDLSRIPLLQDDLEKILYQSFDNPIVEIESRRMKEYALLVADETLLFKTEEEIQRLSELDLFSIEIMRDLYTQSKALKKNLGNKRRREENFVKLIQLIKEEKALYSILGAQLIAAQLDRKEYEAFFALVHYRAPHVNSTEWGLEMKQDPVIEQQAEAHLQILLESLAQRIESDQSTIALLTNRSAISEQDKNTLHHLMSEQRSYVNLKTKLQAQLNEAAQLRLQEHQLLQTLSN